MTDQNKFRVAPSDPRNPFRAEVVAIGGDLEYGIGTIRLTPPALIGSDLLEIAGEAGEHNLKFGAMDKQATLINFYQKDQVGGDAWVSTGQERITLTTDALLCELGGLASSELI